MPKNTRKFTPDMKAFALAEREKGLSCNKISSRILERFKVQVSPSAISWHCLINGAESPNTERRPIPQTRPGPSTFERGGHLVRAFTVDEDARILSLEAQGLSVNRIAKIIGRRSNSILGRLATLARQEARREAANERTV